MAQVQGQQGSERRSKEDSKSQTKETEVTYEALKLNTTGCSKEASSKVAQSDLPNLCLSKEITLADTQSVSTANDKPELVIIDHSNKQRALLHQRAYSHNLLPTPPQGQASTKNIETQSFLKKDETSPYKVFRHRKLRTMQLKQSTSKERRESDKARFTVYSGG